MHKNTNVINELKSLLQTYDDLELAILVGSQASGQATEESDWDIAIRWEKRFSAMQRLAKTEALRSMLAKKLQTTDTKIDLIDICDANLTMRAVVAEEGLTLKGEGTLAWSHFFLRTWRELESFYWNKLYAS